jgi:type II secretory ATPase GspE/PulE/Tfp pilus assembly ATPase PilB-like protein
MVLAKTQSGKTGSMCATIKKCVEDHENVLSIDDIYIITGYSSVEWKEQRKQRLPDCLANRYIYR